MQFLITFNIIVASWIFWLTVYAIVTLFKINKLGKENFEQQTEFLLHRSKSFLIMGIISSILFVGILIGYVLLATLY
ncbi:MAG: hypothetical protein K2J30_02315, partial [Clostridia bacterium]|nr:hypothetical protein [Clostridia bacterium]